MLGNLINFKVEVTVHPQFVIRIQTNKRSFSKHWHIFQKVLRKWWTMTKN